MKVERDGDRIVIVGTSDRDRILAALAGWDAEAWQKAHDELQDAIQAAGLRHSGERVMYDHAHGSLFFRAKGGES